jgi:transcription elongation factor GreA
MRFIASMKRLPISTAGYLALQQELKNRLHARRGLAERIRAAIADEPNLMENSEYHAAQAAQEANEVFISDLEGKIARADIVDVSKGSGETVRFGATVSVIDEDTGETKVWQIVGEPEADARAGRISVTSPTASALLGQTKNTVVEVEVPAGTKLYRIERVQWPDVVGSKGTMA